METLSPTPSPIDEGKSEVRVIGDRLGLPQELSFEELVNEIDKICRWCDSEIEEAEKKIERDRVVDVVSTQPKQFQIILYTILLVIYYYSYGIICC